VFLSFPADRGDGGRGEVPIPTALLLWCSDLLLSLLLSDRGGEGEKESHGDEFAGWRGSSSATARRWPIFSIALQCASKAEVPRVSPRE
jgi:hypothetical protein